METGIFWKMVNSLIKAHKITQAAFSAHIGVNYNTFRGWMYNKRVPDMETALHMAAALGVSLEYLVFGAEGKTGEVHAQQVKERKMAAFRIGKLNNEIRKELERIG